MSKYDDIRAELKSLYEETMRLNTWISSQEEANENNVGEICKSFLQVWESFEWAESTIHERGLDQSKISTTAINYMLTAKTKLLEVLDSYGVKRIEFPEGKFDATKAKIVGTEADPEKEDGTVLRVEREGFYRKEKLLRQAEVTVVKNN